MYHTFRVTTSTNNSSSTEGKIAQQNFCRKRLNRHYLIIIQKTRNVYQHIHSLTFTTSLLSVPLDKHLFCELGTDCTLVVVFL